MPQTAASFLASIGINGSAAASRTLSEMQYLGISALRTTDAEGTALSSYAALGKAGIRFDLVTGTPGGGAVALSTDMSEIDAVAPYVAAVEGPEDVNTQPVTYGNQSGAAAADAFQSALYTAVHADSKLASAQVLPFSLAIQGTTTGYGNVSSSADEANVQSYSTGGAPPQFVLAYNTSNITTVSGKPVVMGETGYYTLADGVNGVSQDVQAKWDVDTLLDDSKKGIATTYLSGLEDGTAGNAATSPLDHYGLFDADGTSKEAATAVHDLTSILADPGASASTPVPPDNLSYAVYNLPQYTGFTNDYEKSDGSFDIALWNEAQYYSSSTGAASSVTPSAVTISLQGLGSYAGPFDVKVYDVITGTAAIASYTNTSSLSVSLGTDPLIVAVSRAPAAPVVAPPTLETQTGDQHVSAGNAFSFALPGSTFSADDAGTLAYSAGEPGGAALPAWLSFNASTLTFSGTAPQSGAIVPIVVTAVSSDGMGAAEEFHLYDAASPILEHQASDQRPSTAAAISFALPTGSYADPSGGTLSYSAMQTTGAALPSWLSFNSATQTFTGTTPQTPTSLAVEVVASSSDGGASAEAFHIYTAAPAAALPPVLDHQAADQRLSPNAAISFALPAGSYTDPSGGTISYSALQTTGAALPSWLSFNSTTDAFSGTAPITSGVLGIEVIATSSEGASSAEAFHLYTASSVENPVLHVQASDQTLKGGAAFSFALPQNSYLSPDGSALSYASEQASMAPLPSWMAFNATTGTFSGTAPAATAGSSAAALAVRVDVTSANGGSSAEAFHIYLK